MITFPGRFFVGGSPAPPPVTKREAMNDGPGSLRLTYFSRADSFAISTGSMASASGNPKTRDRK